jgi:hypothetical protein
MAIPHWLIGLSIFAALGGFVVFAFRKGMSVSREDRDDMGGLPQAAAISLELRTIGNGEARRIAVLRKER